MDTRRCSLCHEDRPTDAFHRTGGGRQSRCKPCRNAAVYRSKRVGGGSHESANRCGRKQQARYRAESRAGAEHHYRQWTGPELELLGRGDLTVRELAEMLSRTYSAVTRMRYRMKTDPRIARLAGTGWTSVQSEGRADD